MTRTTAGGDLPRQNDGNKLTCEEWSEKYRQAVADLQPIIQHALHAMPPDLDDSAPRDCCVYLLCRPTADVRRYIGEGIAKVRSSTHSKFGDQHPNHFLAADFAKYGDLPVFVLIDELTKPEARFLENVMIEEIGTEADGRGPLANRNYGGGGGRVYRRYWYGNGNESMTQKAFDQIMEGLDEALEIAKGEKAPARLHVPAEIDVKAIRKKVGLSQENFAYSFGFTVEQIRSWEQGRSRPLGGVRAYLLMIDLDHESVTRILGSTRKTRDAA